MTKPKSKDTRVLTLARLEAAYGPLYVVLCLDDKPTERNPAADATLWVESIAMPRDIFPHVVAVFGPVLNEPMNAFSVVKSVQVDPGFDFTQLSQSSQNDKWMHFFNTNEGDVGCAGEEHTLGHHGPKGRDQ